MHALYAHSAKSSSTLVQQSTRLYILIVTIDPFPLPKLWLRKGSITIFVFFFSFGSGYSIRHFAPSFHICFGEGERKKTEEEI